MAPVFLFAVLSTVDQSGGNLQVHRLHVGGACPPVPAGVMPISPGAFVHAPPSLTPVVRHQANALEPVPGGCVPRPFPEHARLGMGIAVGGLERCSRVGTFARSGAEAESDDGIGRYGMIRVWSERGRLGRT